MRRNAQKLRGSQAIQWRVGNDGMNKKMASIMLFRVQGVGWLVGMKEWKGQQALNPKPTREPVKVWILVVRREGRVALPPTLLSDPS